MVELKHISKTFQTSDGEFQALKDVNLQIPDGEIYGIIGMSGAGKSTLVRCINMLERPTEGEVLINGRNLCAMSEQELRAQRREITMIFQQFNLLMQRTAEANICFPLEIAGVDKATAKKRPALRRPETARGHRPCSGHRPQCAAVRRGYFRPGPQHHPCDPAVDF